jgi:hypothetical protein
MIDSVTDSGWREQPSPERRDELKKIIADLERDLEIARRAVPDLEAARKVARDLAVIRNLEFMLELAQAEYRHDYEGAHDD